MTEQVTDTFRQRVKFLVSHSHLLPEKISSDSQLFSHQLFVIPQTSFDFLATSLTSRRFSFKLFSHHIQVVLFHSSVVFLIKFNLLHGESNWSALCSARIHAFLSRQTLIHNIWSFYWGSFKSNWDDCVAKPNHIQHLFFCCLFSFNLVFIFCFLFNCRSFSHLSSVFTALSFRLETAAWQSSTL